MGNVYLLASAALLASGSAAASPRIMTAADVKGPFAQFHADALHDALENHEYDDSQTLVVDYTCNVAADRLTDCAASDVETSPARTYIRALVRRVRLKPGVTGPLRIRSIVKPH